MKSAFPQGELSEEVCISQPVGYLKGKPEMVYKLRKKLYGLRQAPRVWYSKIDSYFCIDMFVKCPYEHTLLFKHGLGGNIVIVSLYVDNLIYTSNGFQMMDEFTQLMKGKFDMTNLGRMRCFFGN